MNMKDIREIKSEIRKIVNDTIEAGAIGNVQLFTAKVMAAHDGIEGEDADFYLICAREVVVSEVKKAIGKYDAPDAETPLMAGFEHLRTAYPVHRGGDHLLVPVHLCTDGRDSDRRQPCGSSAKPDLDGGAWADPRGDRPGAFQNVACGSLAARYDHSLC
jgi:hypothetical protein